MSRAAAAREVGTTADGAGGAGTGHGSANSGAPRSEPKKHNPMLPKGC